MREFMAWLSTVFAGVAITLAGLLYLYDPAKDHVLRPWASSGWPGMAGLAMAAPIALLVGGLILAVIGAVSIVARRPPPPPAADADDIDGDSNTGIVAWLLAVPPESGFAATMTRILSNPAGQWAFSLLVVLPLTIIGAIYGHLAWPNAILLVGLMPVAVFLILRTIEALDTERLEVDTHWGGLGGGMGGWRMSRAAVLLLLALATTGGAIAAAVTGAPRDPRTEGQNTTRDTVSTASTSSQGSASKTTPTPSASDPKASAPAATEPKTPAPAPADKKS